MQDPIYRIYTYCPEGMSPSLNNYLSQPVNDEMTATDIIAVNLLGPFGDTRLPFACTFVGWSTERYENQLEKMFAKINDLTTVNQQKIAVESLGLTMEGGSMQIAGAYPLTDLGRQEIEAEYQNVSFILNRNLTEEMMIWIQHTLIDGLLDTDNIGVICAVLGDSEKLVESKMQEILSLLQAAQPEVEGSSNDLETSPDDLNIALAYYSHQDSGLQSYTLFFGSEASVFNSASELLQDVWRHNLGLPAADSNEDLIKNSNATNITDLKDFRVESLDPDGEIARVLYTGKGPEGIAGVLDYLLDDLEDIDGASLWYERDQVRKQLLDFKIRLDNINQDFMNDLRGFIGLILE